ncbi:glycosyl hydrolase family 95 catalytic domain-containing protein [Gracilibacillus thailandensis]|uniref:Glycoside hydrolase family 95 protein n=1 Tax=Gracilibacillus thailandensis TaxID=563735 RepID=A0A6N7R4K8_9BACI|nr:glycoside hydrolase N-terminal domain-containing protein [Gracilibacillus thailandensis]MRI68172.1 glycoside hydrolase family 95 protein [Gracilibacillus thailandensis]
MFDNVSDRNKLVLQYPASWWRNMWREALPAGNGELGAAVYGAIKKETILINHSQLWHMGVKGELPDISHTLTETRALMKDGEYQEANWHLTNEVKKQGYHSKLACPLPLVDLQLEMPCDQGFSRYKRGINMETGEVRVTWSEHDTTFTRDLFVSRADNLIVYRVSSNKANAVDAALNFDLHPTNSPNRKKRYQELADTVEWNTEDNYLFYKATNEDDTDFGAVARVIAEDGEVITDQQKLCCVNVSSLLILVKVFVQSSSSLQWPVLKEELANVTATYQQLLDNHVQVYQPLYFSSKLQLTDDQEEWSNEVLLLDAYSSGEAKVRLYEKLWSFGRYLFISGTKIGGQPFSMYGLWHGDYHLMWSHRMANENIQMMYWHTSVGGLAEFSLTLMEYYQSLMADFRDNARKLFGCRGIYIPAGTTPGIGKPNQLVPVIMNWTAAAGWLAQHFYQYYQFTGDHEYLKQHALPFMKEVADFYQDFLEIGEDGYYLYYPSVSPENTPVNFMPKSSEPVAHPMPTAINATMDFAVMKELLTNLIEGSSIVSIYQQERPIWEKMLELIPPYRINKDGAIKEWLSDPFEDNNEHRHLSHIYPIFPGQELIKEKGEPLFEPFRKAVQQRKLGAQTSWSFAHMASIYARLQDAAKASTCLENLSRSCLLNNFYTVHNDWRNMGLTMEIDNAPVQMDANLGIVNAIQEMLIYVSPTLVKLLPALPDDWKSGQVDTFHFCTGTISFRWDLLKGTFSTVLKAERETIITLGLPSYLKYEWEGDGKVSPSKLGESYYQIQLSAQQSLRFFSQ